MSTDVYLSLRRTKKPQEDRSLTKAYSFQNSALPILTNADCVKAKVCCSRVAVSPEVSEAEAGLPLHGLVLLAGGHVLAGAAAAAALVCSSSLPCGQCW